MKNRLIIQFFLITIASLLIFFTYYYKNTDNQFKSSVETGIDKADETIKSSDKTTNIIVRRILT